MISSSLSFNGARKWCQAASWRVDSHLQNWDAFKKQTVLQHWVIEVCHNVILQRRWIPEWTVWGVDEVCRDWCDRVLVWVLRWGRATLGIAYECLYELVNGYHGKTFMGQAQAPFHLNGHYQPAVLSCIVWIVTHTHTHTWREGAMFEMWLLQFSCKCFTSLPAETKVIHACWLLGTWGTAILCWTSGFIYAYSCIWKISDSRVSSLLIQVMRRTSWKTPT